MLSSTGNCLALRIKSFVALLIPVVNILLEKFGVNLATEQVDGVIDAVFLIVFAVLQIYGWARNIIFRKEKLGRYA